MKKTVIIVVGLLLCAAAVTVIGQKKVLSPKEERREVREKRRAERIANYEKFMDSLVLSRNFQFNPTTFQRQPAGLRSFNDGGSIGSNAVASGDGAHQRVGYFRLAKLPVEGGDKGRKHPFPSVGHREGTDFCPAGGQGVRKGCLYFC